MYDPEGVWKRRIILGVIAAVVILLAGGTGFLLAGGDNDDGPATAPPTEAPADEDGEESSSKCGLPDGAQEVPAIGPDADWQPVDDLLTPRTEEFGPGEESLNIHSCFARNPTGALLAATTHLSDRNNVGVDQVEFARSRYAQIDGYDELVERFESGESYDEPAGSPAQIAGFRFYDYSSDRAEIEIVLESTDPDLAIRAPYIGVTVEFIWSDGDWLRVPTNGEEPPPTTPQDLSQYVVWAAGPNPNGVPSLDEGAAPSAATDGRGRGAAAAAAGGFGMSAPVVVSDETGEGDPGVDVPDEDDPITDPLPDDETEDPADDGTDERESEPVCDDTISCIGDGIKATLPGVGPIVDAPGAIASDVAGSALEEFAARAQEAAEWAIEELLTAWLNYPDPNVQAENSAAKWLQNNLDGLVVFAVVFSVIVSAIRLVVTQQFEHMRELGSHLARVILVGGLTLVVVNLGVQAGDLLTGWLLNQTEVDLGGSGVTGLLAVTAGLTNGILIIIVALLIVVAQIIQLALMVIRTAVVTFLAGALPLAAATSQTQAGKQSYQKMVTWLAAFVLYKPAAALVYMMAIRMTNSDQDIASRFAGLGLMILAIVALPALLRLLVPVTASLGSSSGGSMAMAGMGAAVATGAMVASGGAAGGAAAAAGAGTNSAPTGGGITGGGSGGSVGSGGSGGGKPPAGSKSGGEPSTNDSVPTRDLQPVGAGAGVESEQRGAQAPQHDAGSGAAAGSSGGPGSSPGSPARGADERLSGGSDLRLLGPASQGAASGRRAGDAASGAVAGEEGR